MHYVISDIHNDDGRFCEMLARIHFSEQDHLFILGDVFDRSDFSPNPVDLYFHMLELEDRCTILCGNHDQILAAYISDFYHLPEWKRRKIPPYPYNTFRIFTRRLTPVDIQNLADVIASWPLQITVEVDHKKYLLAHAMTSAPGIEKPLTYYLMGSELNQSYLKNGIDDYISICGHRTNADHSIWKNEKENVYMIDCGCGFKSGRLGCLCLETEEEFYV